MSWNDKIQVKKGCTGERIVKAYLESIGYVIYEPTTDAAHLVDFLLMYQSKGNKQIVCAEVKTKPRRIKYEDTGLNTKNYNEYLTLMDKHNVDIFLFFVDDYCKKVYGNKVSILRKVCYEMGQQTYFPLTEMKQIKELTDEEVNEIRQYNSSNKTYNSAA